MVDLKGNVVLQPETATRNCNNNVDAKGDVVNPKGDMVATW